MLSTIDGTIVRAVARNQFPEDQRTAGGYLKRLYREMDEWLDDHPNEISLGNRTLHGRIWYKNNLMPATGHEIHKRPF